MCLIIHQPSTLSLTDDLLVDIYDRNKDGLGIMYADSGRLHVHKSLPANAQQFIAAYREHADGREALIHARMQTHGDIDLANCHPYEVTSGVALMHNGILSLGNSWDKTKSDTWHFVERVIAPAVRYDLALIHSPEWQSYIASIIGSTNKFAMMDHHGQVAILNRHTGVEFEGGWWSNTYAWPAATYGCKVDYGRWSAYASDGYEDYDFGNKGSTSATTSATTTGTAVTPQRWVRGGRKVEVYGATSGSILQIWRAAKNCYVRNSLLQWVYDAPEKAERLLNAISQDASGEIGGVVWTDPEDAAEWIEQFFETDGNMPADAPVRLRDRM